MKLSDTSGGQYRLIDNNEKEIFRGEFNKKPYQTYTIIDGMDCLILEEKRSYYSDSVPISNSNVSYAYPTSYISKNVDSFVSTSFPDNKWSGKPPLVGLLHLKYKGQNNFQSKTLITKTLHLHQNITNFKFVYDNCYILLVDNNLIIWEIFRNTTTNTTISIPNFI